MKKTLISFVVLGLVSTAAIPVYAQTKKPTPTKESTSSASLSPTKAKTSPTSVESDVKKLREKVAAKVSELKKKNYKPFAGEITKLSDSTLSISTNQGDVEVKIDSTLTTIYQISGTSKKEISTSDLEKGNYIIVTGPVLDKTVTANLIFVDEPYVVGSGKIIEVDTENFFVKVVTDDKSTYTFDIEKNTTEELLNIKTLKPEKIGFSKLKEGDMLHFVANKSKEKKSTRFTALKLLVVPQEYFNK